MHATTCHSHAAATAAVKYLVTQLDGEETAVAIVARHARELPYQ